MYATLHWFSSLAPVGQVDKGSSPALLILTMEQPFLSINALVLTLFRLAESCIFKWFGYIMIGHSKGSYPVRFYNDLFPDDVKGILLVDPSQYGQDYNMVAKWKPDLEVYAESINEQRLLELEVFNNPKNTTYNPFMIDLKKNELELKKTSTFGSVPFVLLWAKNGHSIGSVPSKDWHPDVWFRMAAMYKLAIENMHTNLSTDTTIAYSKTTEHDIFFVEPQAVVKQLELLSSKVLQQP